MSEPGSACWSEKRVARPPKSSQIITANRLIDGRVVFLTQDLSWSSDLGNAQVFPDPASAEGGIKSAQTSAANGEIVDPYAISVSLTDGRAAPTLLRERIRADGPTIEAGPKAA